jgi:hypothetical protein
MAPLFVSQRPRVPQEQGISLSDAIRIAMVKYLKENGIDWREEE